MKGRSRQRGIAQATKGRVRWTASKAVGLLILTDRLSESGDQGITTCAEGRSMLQPKRLSLALTLYQRDLQMRSLCFPYSEPMRLHGMINIDRKRRGLEKNLTAIEF